MLTRLVRTIRERFHPLHHARQNRLLSRHLFPLLDRPLSVRLRGVDWPVRVRLIRHLSYILDSRIVEPGETALFAVLCRRYQPGVFWDIGANIGLYSWLALSANPAARAVLFEPDPDNLALLSRTVRDAAILQATVVPCAVSDNCGEAVFLPDRDTGHTGGLAPGPARGGINVRTVTLDAMSEAGPPPDLVKIDGEGGEAAVFAGAGRLIGAIQPILLFESFAAARAPILARLGAAGYIVIGAENPDRPMDEAFNFLALPPRHAADLDTVRDAWRSELARSGLGRKGQVPRTDHSPSSRS